MKISLTNLRAIYRAVVPPAVRRHIFRARSSLRGVYSDPERKHTRDFMRWAFRALRNNGIAGDYAEFGSHTGRTFSLAYRESRRWNYNCKLWSFDSFCGLPPRSVPEEGEWIEGSMRTSIEEFKKVCRRRGIPESVYRIVPGFYEDTLTSRTVGDQLPDVIAMAYIDCVLYSSAKTVLEFLAARIRHGSIVAFDDYFCYSATSIAGERRACAEFLKANPHFHFSPYCRYSWHGMSFIVEDKTYWKTVDCTVLP